MRIGISLPQFRDDPEPTIETARRAEAAGVDGVFVFDHLWPLGQPERPALHSTTLLGALVAETERVVLGTLVARVGLVADAVLAHTLVTLHRMSGPGRFIAGLGTGDRGNRDENTAYGIPFASAAERLASVRAVARMLRGQGVRTWIGGLSAATQQAAAAEADGWNGWGISATAFTVRAAELPAGVESTWGGQVLVGRTQEEAEAKRARYGDRPGLVSGTVEDLARHFGVLSDAGATWAICAPLDIGTDPSAPELVMEAAR